MITEKQFNDAFTTAGGKFIANNFEFVSDNINKSTAEMISVLYLLGYDSKVSGTKARIFAMRRLLKEDQGIKVLNRIAKSTRIDQNAVELAQKILKNRFGISM